MSDYERRDRCYAACRAEVSESGRRFQGYAIVFNSPSLDLGGFTEMIAPEAVDRTLHEGLEVHAYFDHDSGKVLGNTRAGTLRLRKDNRGLSIDIEADPEISFHRDLLRSVGRGDISGMSFGFRVMPSGDDWDGDVRTVRDMRISEVSIVSKPAYPSTDVSVAMRSMQAYQAEQSRSRISFLEKVHRTKLAG